MEIQVGNIRIQSVVEQSISGLEQFIKEANPETLANIPWLAPHYINADNQLLGLVQSFVVQTGDKRILVDTCVGNDKERPHDAQWHQQQRQFLDNFQAAGFDPNSIDIVLCTHLHVDHVGWNCQLVDGHWKPTFPNARYLFEARELEHWQALASSEEPLPPADESRKDAALRHFRETQRLTWADSVQPIIDAGLAEPVDVRQPYPVCDSVTLIPTPGHTIGHVSVLVTGGADSNDRAVISGDCVHHPCQIAHPSWRTLVDYDYIQAGNTRVQLFTDLAANGGWLIGSHFNNPCCGRLRTDGDTFYFDTPEN